MMFNIYLHIAGVCNGGWWLHLWTTIRQVSIIVGTRRNPLSERDNVLTGENHGLRCVLITKSSTFCQILPLGIHIIWFVKWNNAIFQADICKSLKNQKEVYDSLWWKHGVLRIPQRIRIQTKWHAAQPQWKPLLITWTFLSC